MALNPIPGTPGPDVLSGPGDDLMTGGAGDDTYIVNTSDDEVVEQSGEGNDGIYTSVTYTLADNVEALVLKEGGGAIDGTGTQDGDWLFGNTFVNHLIGLNGRDILVGGGGADTLEGGLGDDVYGVDDAGVTVLENSGEGSDVIYATVSVTLSDNVEGIVLKELGGAINAFANVNANGAYLWGNSFANVLADGGGKAVMLGGAGDDVYSISNGSSVIGENADEGSDVLYSGVSYVLPDNIESFVLYGSADISGIGNAAANWIFGNAGNNLLRTGGGADDVSGGDGNDTLYDDGQAAALAGEGDDDTYYVANAGTLVVEYAGEGTDIVYASVSYALAKGSWGLNSIETLILEEGSAAIEGTGNDAANRIVGNSADNVLRGGTLTGNWALENDADWLIGGGGEDDLYGGVGADVFFYNTPEEGGDEILDFGLGGNDIIAFDHVGFGVGTGSPFEAGVIVLFNRAAFDQSPALLIRHPNPGGENTQSSVYWDPDGTGPEPEVLIATCYSFEDAAIVGQWPHEFLFV